MPTGRVVFFNAVKGYGFIAPDDHGVDLFVHMDAVSASGLQTICTGQRLRFRVLGARNGKRSATELQPIDGEEIGSPPR
ncbi:cold shock domain-containing protein [Novosphingobium sp. PhB55]|uniref:cold-shock protein n=1 Tax=Novosphingobium sp. PhB55 TaxID=2485106 RepID=UPI0010658F45|nr:cold shock domain-containing protein [Novosphingobium sp. PhB55]